MGVPCNWGHSQHGASHRIPKGHLHWSHQSYELLGDNRLPEGYHPIRLLSQERHGASLKVAKELPSLTKPPLLWIFESGFINGLP